MRLLGLDFADLTAADAAAWLARRPASAPFGYVTTPNADHLVRLHRRPDLRPLYEGAMLRLLDSRVVALAARLLGLPTPHVAPGSDLTALLLASHLQAEERITIVGLSPAWLPSLVARCRPDRTGTFRSAARLRARSRHAACRGGLRRGASGALHVPRGRFAAAGDARRGHRGDGPCHRRRALHRRKPGVHRRRAAARARLDAAHRPGMAAPAWPRSVADGATLPGGQSGDLADAAARAPGTRERLTRCARQNAQRVAGAPYRCGECMQARRPNAAVRRYKMTCRPRRAGHAVSVAAGRSVPP